MQVHVQVWYGEVSGTVRGKESTDQSVADASSFPKSIPQTSFQATNTRLPTDFLPPFLATTPSVPTPLAGKNMYSFNIPSILVVEGVAGDRWSEGGAGERGLVVMGGRGGDMVEVKMGLWVGMLSSG